jgi:hypothetical protein
MIDLHPPPACIQIARKETPSPPLQPVASQSQSPSPLPPAPDRSQPQQPPPSDGQPAQGKVVPLDVGRFLPHTALFATIIVTVVPPTGTVEIHTPGFDDTPVVFKGPKSAGEIRLNGPIVYVHLKNGATAYEVEYLSWREPTDLR